MQGHAFAVDLNVLPLGDCELVFSTTVTLVGLHPIDHSLQEGKQFFKQPVRKGILL